MPENFNGQRVEAIPGTPLPFGLASAANLLLVDDVHELNGVRWNPMSCADAQTTDWCADDIADKTFDGSSDAIAQPVTVYYGLKCPPIGWPKEDADTYARAGLAIGEPRALEAWVQINLLAPVAVDLTPGGPVGAAEGVSLLEGASGETFGGIGVIHAPVGASALLARDYQLVRDGARMVTWAGNRVALGGGYQVANVGPDGTPGDPGTLWLYISGPVTIRQQQPNLPGGRPEGEPEAERGPAYEGVIDITLNDRYTLAERTSVPQIECDVFAALIEAPQVIS